MNTRRMTPAELRAIIDAAGITMSRAAEITQTRLTSILCYSEGVAEIPAPVSLLLCSHLLLDGLAVDLARPWVPDDLAAVLAPP